MKFFRKSVSLILTTIIVMTSFCVFFGGSVDATSTAKGYYVKVNRAPRISKDRTNEKFLLLNLVDNAGISYVKVEVFDNKAGKYKQLDEANLDSKDKSDSNEEVYISDDLKTIKLYESLFNTEEYTQICITTKDIAKSEEKVNTVKATYLVRKFKKVSSKGAYYSVKVPPTIYSDLCNEYYSTKEVAIKGGTQFRIKQSSGIYSVGIVDENNNKTEVFNKTFKSKMEEVILSMDLNKLKVVNNVCRFRIELVSFDGTVRNEVIELTLKTKKVDKEVLVDDIWNEAVPEYIVGSYINL